MEDNVRYLLLQASLELFAEKGYGNTSVNAIIEQVGVSKGAFYHYFASKEEVLSALCSSYLEEQLQVISQAAATKGLSPVDQLLWAMTHLYARRKRDVDSDRIYGVLQQNVTVPAVARAVRETNAKAAQVYGDIIAAGTEAGEFNTSFPREAAELFVQLVNIFRRELARPDEDMAARLRRLRFYEDTLCRLLGTNPTTLPLAERLMDSMKRGVSHE